MQEYRKCNNAYQNNLEQISDIARCSDGSQDYVDVWNELN